MAKLRIGQEAYQLSGVAQSLDDYYTGSGEAPGVWIGEGSRRLGLEGHVSADDLRAVLAGIAPAAGGLSPNGEAIRPHPRRVPGFDLTFKVPKSVSVLYAVSDDPRVQGAIIEAGDHALRETVSWLERNVVHVRRGTGNQRFLADLASRDPLAAEAARLRTLPAAGVVAAAFRHRTSRAGDPLLHWHTLVANMAEGEDGRWSAFVHPDLYRSGRATGEVFQAILRAELTERLGLVWRPGRHVPEVAGVPQSLCDVFSKRSKEIDAWLESTGVPDDREGRQRAVLATRRHKPEVEGQRFDLGWKAEALAHGWGPDAADDLIRDAATSQASRSRQDDRPFEALLLSSSGTRGSEASTVASEEWIRELLRELTREDATFTRSELIRTIASRLGEGATMTTLERLLARTLASSELVSVETAGATPMTQRWTSREHLDIEERLARAFVGTDLIRTPIDDALVERVLASRNSVGDDQAEAVRLLTTSEAALSVLVGPAGTGKTYTLDTVRTVFETAGYRVLGAAPSARAALELESGAGIPTETLQRRTGEWTRGFDAPNPRTVLVIDEAGMAATRDLEPLVTRTIAAGGRVILSGDHRQLPEVTAGGGFGHAVDHASTVAVLRVNRRQHEPWEREALTQLREQHVATAVHAYRAHDRVVVTDDRQAMLAAAVDRWFDAHAAGKHPVLLAGTNEVVDALNRQVRRELVARGQLGGTSIGTWGGRSFVVGDRIVLRSNSYRERTPEGDEIAVLNGQAGTILAGTDTTLVVRLDRDQRTVELGESYLRHGWVDHGYALTSHRAQGGTWDLAIAVGTDGLYREGAYVQLSRGRESNWLVVTRAQLDALDEELERHDHGLALPSEAPGDIDDELIERLSTSRAKLMALARDPHAGHIDHLARSYDLPTLEAAAREARTLEHRVAANLRIDPDALTATAARARHTAQHLACGQQVKAHDRHNIGTVSAIDDHAGTATVQFASATGTHATRTLRWDQLEIVVPREPDPRSVTSVVDQTLERLLVPIEEQLTAWQAQLGAHGVHPLDARHAEQAARHHIDRAAARLVALDPQWLHDLIGPRPTRALPAQVWEQAVADIAAFRARHHIADHIPGLGDITTDSSRRSGRQELAARVTATSLWLQTYDSSPTVGLVRTRSTAELETRRAELTTILDQAPADQRHALAGLRTEGRLPLDDTAAMVNAALDAQDARRDWILAHWPHVVEYAEIHRTLTQRAAGPNTAAQVEALAASHHNHLARAALGNEPWLHAVLSVTTEPDATHVAPNVAAFLEQIADYRQRWSVDHQTPLGIAATSPDQAAERTALGEHLTLDAHLAPELQEPMAIDRDMVEPLDLF